MATPIITQQQAAEAALEVIARIKPYCERAQLTGDARLGLAHVTGLSIICQPQRIVLDEKAIFSDKVVHPGFGSAINQGPLRVIKGKHDGKKAIRFFLIHSLDMWIKTDLFMYDGDDYYRQLALSTGNDNFKFKALYSSWYKKGWVSTADGLRLRKECEQKGKTAKRWVCTAISPTVPTAWNSERELFEWSGIKWCEPEARNWK